MRYDSASLQIAWYTRCSYSHSCAKPWPPIDLAFECRRLSEGLRDEPFGALPNGCVLFQPLIRGEEEQGTDLPHPKFFQTSGRQTGFG